jgi:hypothetical protein
LSRHRKVHGNRSKLVALVASGAFSIATASTAVAVTWPSSASASSAQLTSVTQPQVTTGSVQTRQEQALRARLAAEAAAQKAAAARKAAAKKKAEEAAAAKKKKAEEAAAAKKKAEAEYSGTPQQVAQAMLSRFGWSSDQFSCLDPLWDRESGWNVYAYNPGSGAYGIPQALPGSRMASAGSDWQSSASTQIRWGLEYIQETYGSPCGAWAHEEDDGWY